MFEGAVEACGQCVASEDVGEACVAQGRIAFGYRGEGAQRVCVGVDDALSVDAQGGDADAVCVGCAGGDGEALAGCVEGDDAPVASGRALCQGEAESSGDLACVAGVRGVG